MFKKVWYACAKLLFFYALLMFLLLSLLSLLKVPNVSPLSQTPSKEKNTAGEEPVVQILQTEYLMILFLMCWRLLQEIAFNNRFPTSQLEFCKRLFSPLYGLWCVKLKGLSWNDNLLDSPPKVCQLSITYSCIEGITEPWLVTSWKQHYDLCSEPQQTQQITGSVFQISVKPDWQINFGVFNRLIKVCTAQYRKIMISGQIANDPQKYNCKMIVHSIIIKWSPLSTQMILRGK